MSEQYAFTADAEGPPRLRFYIYRTKAGADGKAWWMFTVDEYDDLGRSNPIVERLGEKLSDVVAYPAEYTSEPLEWGYMAGGEPVDLDEMAARLG